MQQQYQKAINTQPQENQSQLDDLADITPLPWTVESHRDTEGGYIILEARHEQLSWCDEGYDISNEEGERRSLGSPEYGRVQAIEVLEEINPHCLEMKITCGENEVSP